ncbi:uncharacterized protein FIBRA_02197 [Fibroporia radiculosa]|uniref:Uncharacterized protein n=1 Tax=Fibroporia radiculosa TaxID=599839 RepID=J4H1Q2_9APHY|nr:uncharacterized protein FIBRA_02197 [Fibroporia radiculosa]CCM00169.1 predicted protein [Fibroporia radiculosa]
MKRNMFDEIIQNDVPGPNANASKAKKLRSFQLGSPFVVEGSRNASAPRLINIFAAVVCTDVVFALVDFARLITLRVISIERHWEADDFQPVSAVWALMWGSGHGPDWIDEPESAKVVAHSWRSKVLSNDRFGCVPMVKQLSKDFILALQREIYWASKSFLNLVAGVPNFDNPLTFNDKSNRNYFAHFVWVYRRQAVRIPKNLNDRMARAGLFDPQHTIGQDYNHDPDPALLTDTRYRRKEQPVLMYKQGQFCVYTPILAKPPSHWRFQPDYSGVLADDAQHAGYKTTLGSAQFHNQVQNKIDPNVKGKPGRPKKEKTGRRGRPAKPPQTAILRQKTYTGAHRCERLLKATNTSSQVKNEDMSEKLPTAGISSPSGVAVGREQDGKWPLSLQDQVLLTLEASQGNMNLKGIKAEPLEYEAYHHGAHDSGRLIKRRRRV